MTMPDIDSVALVTEVETSQEYEEQIHHNYRSPLSTCTSSTAKTRPPHGTSHLSFMQSPSQTPSQTELLLDLHRKVNKISDVLGGIVKVLRKKHSYKSEEETKQEYGIDLITVGRCDPPKYAQSLMDYVFSQQEMKTCCFIKSSKSKKPGLPQEKIRILQEYVERRFGNGAWGKSLSEIKRKCNQKCIDKSNKSKQTVVSYIEEDGGDLIEKKVHVPVDDDDDDDQIEEIED